MAENARGRDGRYEYRIVLDGVRLDERQDEAIAVAVQKAAFDTLARVDLPLDGPVVVAPANLKFPEWLGLWILNGPGAVDVGDKLQGLTQFQRGDGG